MTDLPIGTLFKLLEEHFDSKKPALTVDESEQIDYIKQLAGELEKVESVSTGSLSDWIDGFQGRAELPGVEIKIESSYNEQIIGTGSFVVRFVEGSDKFSAFAKPWSHDDEAFPVHSTSQVMQMVGRIKGIFNQVITKDRVKDQQEHLSNQFVFQGLKARLAVLSQKKKFDFAIHIDHDWIEVLVEKDDIGPASITLSKDEKTRETELESLAEWIDHAIVHLPYIDRIGSGSYRIQYGSDLQWYRSNELQ